MKKYPSISVIVRALNEQKFLSECMSMVRQQDYKGETEIVLVDSGSTDDTVSIAERFGAKIVHIRKEDFSFGKSLNLGCRNSNGDILVLLSAHCIPLSPTWLSALITPITENLCDYSYGKQVSRIGVSKFSEGMVFDKYYPSVSKIPQRGYFCNNANSALSVDWEKYQFDESTGLEDMELAKRLTTDGGKIGYVAESGVEHIHEENWKKIKLRYEREAVALADIEPSLNLTLIEAIIICIRSVFSDICRLQKLSFSGLFSVICYRLCQYWGSFVGSKLSKKRIAQVKRNYFFPDPRKILYE